MRRTSRTSVRLCLALAVFSYSIAAPPAHADSGRTLDSEPDEAKRQSATEHIRVGMIAFEKKNYVLAITELRAAFADVPDPAFLYALGQAYRMNGDCAHAREAYRSFIESNPSEKQRDAATANIERCVPAEPAAPAKPEAAAPRVSEETTSPARKRWYEDVPGGVLTGGGVVTTVVGAVLFAGGRGKVEGADAVTDDGAFAQNRDEADAGLTQQRVGIVAMGLGGALITAGIVRYVSVAHEAPASSVRVGLTLGGVAAVGVF